MMLRWLLGEQDEVLPPRLDTVAVSLRTGSTMYGALVARDAEVMILKGALLLGLDRNGNDTKDRIDGDAVIPMANIDFWQSGLDPAVIATLSE